MINFLSAYTNINLGDDLFLKVIDDRYICKFICLSSNKYIYKYKHIKFINRYVTKIIYKLKNKFNIKLPYNFLINKCENIIIIGGSMFIEGKSKMSQIYNLSKSIYILGSNFGPYKTEKFFKEYKEVFNHVKDICFREEHSYELFKDLPNVRYASDIVFTLDTSNIKITNNKKVVISVIDCNKKINSKYTEIYEEKIMDLIKLFYVKSYEITLMSYCKFEGDEFAIERIISKLDDEKIRENINKYFYNGNIEEALNVIGDCQVVVGTRFHANILGLVMNKTIIPIAYSDKTLNVLEDMNFKGKVFDIRDMDNFNVDSLTDEDLNYKLDVSYQKKDAQRQFEKLDEILDRRENNE